jgi:hypothetical protein
MGKAPTRWLVEASRGGRHSCPLPLAILSGPDCFRRHSCWRNLIFIIRLWLPRWSRQPATGAAGPLAGASLSCLTPWRLLGCQPEYSAALGIPLKSSPRHLPPKLAKSHGLAWGFGGFLSSPKSCSLLSKSQGPSPDPEVVDLEAKSRRASLAISRCAGSKTDLVGGRRAAASRGEAVPWNLCRFRPCPYAVACATQQRPVLSC